MKTRLIVALFLAASGSAGAAEIRLADGSVVFGSILRLENGEDLFIDTAHMDEVIVEWASVTQLRDTEVVDIELFDGNRYAGRITRDGSAVELQGDQTIQLASSDVFRIDEHNETFWEGFSADTDLGMNLVRGNNQVTQLSIGAGVAYDSQTFETSLRGNSIINEQAEVGDTRRSTITGSYTHKYSNGWQTIGSLQFETDEQQGLDGRTLLAGALGKRIYNQRKHRVELFSGLALNLERFTGLPQSDSLEGLFGSRYRMRSFADIDTTLILLPSLEDNDRLRVQFDAAISFDLYADLDFKITMYDRYDSQPPAGNETNDTGVTLGLSWSH